MYRSVIFLGLAIIISEQTSTKYCDKRQVILPGDGSFGATPHFNWLGLFKVLIDDGELVKEAVTGIVLIKYNYVLANADDIAKIPENIFLEKSTAMFITRDRMEQYRPLSYVTHPEYDSAVYSSIAVIKLAVPKYSPLLPICFTNTIYDTDRLYLFGYTDENRNHTMEKIVYKIRSIDKQQCDLFYKKEGLIDQRREPASYVCGVHEHSRAPCVWENGLVLATNTSRWFTLVGFSVHGPGCAAPARFIFMLHYHDWIHSVTHDDSGSGRADDDNEEVHLHEIQSLDKINSYRRQFVQHSYILFPGYGETKLDYFTIAPTYDDDEHAIAIYPFDTTQEMFYKACQTRRALMYQEEFAVTSQGTSSIGSVTYKLSMYDLKIGACSCVTLTVKCTSRSHAYLTLRDEINFISTEDIVSPEDIFRVFPVGKTTTVHNTTTSTSTTTTTTTTTTRRTPSPSEEEMMKRYFGKKWKPPTPPPPDYDYPYRYTKYITTTARSNGYYDRDDGTTDEPPREEFDPSLDANFKIDYLQGGPVKGKVLSYDLFITLNFDGIAALNFKIFGEPPMPSYLTTTPPPPTQFPLPYGLSPNKYLEEIMPKLIDRRRMHGGELKSAKKGKLFRKQSVRAGEGLVQQVVDSVVKESPLVAEYGHAAASAGRRARPLTWTVAGLTTYLTRAVV